jgi:hypothetical protein
MASLKRNARETKKVQTQEVYMKLHLRSVVLTAGLSALLGSLTLSAQDQKEVANIPFAYHVGQQNLPAGKYTVGETSTHGILQLRDNASGHSILVPVIPEDTGKSDSKLTFGCYAGQCSLSEVWMAGDVYKLRAKQFPREAKNQLGVVAMVSIPLLSR